MLSEMKSLVSKIITVLERFDDIKMYLVCVECERYDDKLDNRDINKKQQFAASSFFDRIMTRNNTALWNLYYSKLLQFFLNKSEVVVEF